jgi:hypothetical protein
VVDDKVRIVRLERTLERARKTISLIREAIIHIREFNTKGSGDLNGESTTIMRREVAQQEVGINIQTGEHSNVCLFPFSSYNFVL